MNQQLARIKNRDLSSVDQKLFVNLNKVQSITSTLDNLQKFQQFLLTQIGNFEQQAKKKNNHNKEVKDIISQNCEILKQSILKVLPDLECSRAKFRETIFSPLSHQSYDNGKKNNDNKMRYFNKNNQVKQTLDKNNLNTQQLKQINKLQQQLQQLKQQLIQLKSQQKQISSSIIFNNKKIIQQKLCGLFKQNTTLKKTLNKLKQENTKLLFEIVMLKENENDGKNKFIESKKVQQTIKKQQDKADKFVQKQEQLSNKKLFSKQQYNNIEKDQQKEKQSPFTQQKPKKQSTSTYLSFVQKMKLDFSAKLQKINNNNNNNNIYGSITKFDQPKSFRQSNINNNDEFETKYNSIELSLNKKQPVSRLQAPQIPRLLRNKSISSHSRESSMITTSEISLKHNNRIPLSQQSINFSSSYNKNNKIPSSLSSIQIQKQLICQSIQKKSNHDLMRKTKSKFFDSINMKKNEEICKIKGLENVENLVPEKIQESNYQNKGERKRTMSKQKLKIFSMV